MKRKIFTALSTLALVLVVVSAGGWLAFVPGPREPAYPFVMTWGERGNDSGQFNDPTGIAVASDKDGGEVFIADSRNNRIQVFDQDGGFRRQFGKPGEGLGQLGRPMNLRIANGELYVAEYWNDRIQVFGLDGTPRRIIGSSGGDPGQFEAPGGVAVASNGDLFVADFYNQRVQHLRPDGSFVAQWGTTGEIGIRAGTFNYPTDVAMGPDGRVFVGDGYNDRVQVFAPDGDFQRKWGGPFGMNIFGPFNGWFATVTSLTIDANGAVFVADFYNHRIQKFDAEGGFLTAFGERGSGPGQFTYVTAIAVAEDGAIFAADFGNNRILKWRPPTMDGTEK